ncbi:hypothetical protein B4Q04_10985 [Zobellia sp. OII3]|uniref:hypothetical protein n=1 Tax=Zobellia sp. OII3 TaxID=2034520 RepID=UPI000B532AEB|nr:hypothetical protein [Zobellia sp. OII3]OWW25065.1 hypothetical protein B4Q04_10985 [Zobellia sp. OII3]
MEKNHQIELVLNDNLSLQELEITNRYWFIEDGVFKETPSNIGREFGLRSFEISTIARNGSYLNITQYCSGCKLKQELKANSITLAKTYLKPSWTCTTCLKQIEQAEFDRLKDEKILTQKRRSNKFVQATEEKAWYKFTRSELKLLIQMLQAPSTKHLIEKLIELKEKKYWSILHRANEYGLVDLVKNSKNYIIQHYPLYNLEEHVKPYLEVSQKPPSSNKEEHSRISFRMLKNKNRNSVDDPLNNGVIKLENDVVLKAGEPLSYALYARENGDVHLSITPSDKIVKYKNLPRTGGPKHSGDINNKYKS